MLLAEIDSQLLTEWMGFFQLEPWGYETEMMGHGIVASRIDNLFKKEDEIGSQPSDYIPQIVWSEDDSDDDQDEEDPFIRDLKEYFRRRA